MKMRWILLDTAYTFAEPIKKPHYHNLCEVAWFFILYRANRCAYLAFLSPSGLVLLKAVSNRASRPARKVSASVWEI
jgi:hypothetical protein